MVRVATHVQSAVSSSSDGTRHSSHAAPTSYSLLRPDHDEVELAISVVPVINVDFVGDKRVLNDGVNFIDEEVGTSSFWDEHRLSESSKLVKGADSELSFVRPLVLNRDDVVRSPAFLK